MLAHRTSCLAGEVYPGRNNHGTSQRDGQSKPLMGQMDILQKLNNFADFVQIKSKYVNN